MVPSTLKVALSQLLDLTPRGGVTPNSFDDVLGLTARFVKEYQKTGLGDELAQRAAKFDELTAPKGSFDRTRADACELVRRQRDQWVIYDEERFAPRPLAVPYVTEDGRGLWMRGVPRSSQEANYTIQICTRLADPGWVKWHLPEALADTERLLGLGTIGPLQRKILADWQQNLRDLSSQSDKEYLFGCFLLRSCSCVVDPNPDKAARYNTLLRHFKGSYFTLMRVLQDTASYLVALAEDAADNGKGLPSTSTELS